jgi:hypothetical protein
MVGENLLKNTGMKMMLKLALRVVHYLRFVLHKHFVKFFVDNIFSIEGSRKD